MLTGPGARLDAYELIRLLGAGGMGEVWLAHDVSLGRKVAVKLLPQGLTEDPHRVARFEQEARAVSGLSHPNICHVYALGRTDEGQRYIAMELVDGTTLRHRLNASHLPLLEALRIASQIAAGASAAHAAGIIHRDLKPENVMIRTDALVKILDFGLAKLSQVGDGSAAGEGATHTVLMTNAGSVVGTVAYMSPEQARGQALDVRTDVWSLGVMLYELAAGRGPFTGQSTSDVLASILEREPDPLVRFEPAAPSELQRIVGKALRKEPGQRYQTMSDLALDLEALRDDLHVKSKTSSGAAAVDTRTTYWSRRRLTRIGVSAAILALAVAAWSMLGSTRRRGATESDAPVQRRLTRLTFDELAWSPTFSPDGRYVAYVSSRSGYSNVWVLATAGGRPIQVTKSSSDESWPDFRRMATRSPSLVVAKASSWCLRWEARSDASRRSPALRLGPRTAHRFWSPNIRLFLATADGPPERILERFLEGGFWLSPTWHPDGRITIPGRHKTAGRGIFTFGIGTARG
jgi:serine/threonine protein kinase